MYKSEDWEDVSQICRVLEAKESQVHPRAESCSLAKTQVILHNLTLDSWA